MCVKGCKVFNTATFSVCCTHAHSTCIAVRSVKLQIRLAQRLLIFQSSPRHRIKIVELFKPEVACPTRGQSFGDLGGFQNERARSTHDIDHRFGPVVTALTQEHRSQGFAHWGFVHRNLMAALVQQLARSIDTDGTQVILDPDHDLKLSLFRDHCAELFLNRRFNPLRRGTGMINFGFTAHNVNTHRNVRA